MTKIKGHSEPATASQIRSIAGFEDHGYITSILNLGATPAQVLQAFQLYEIGDKSCTDAVVRQVCDILEAQRDLNDLSERL